jgi:glucose-6-phosphate 1-epimerase
MLPDPDPPFERIVLEAEDGARAEIIPYGAQVVSWRPAKKPERLFLSNRAVFREGIPVRGGIPVCFPQFGGQGPLTKHGFARIQAWRIVGADRGGPQPHVELSLEDAPGTRQAWPFAFEARLTVSLAGSALRVRLAVVNRDRQTFAFTGALHTYLRVDDLAGTTVANLKGCRYRDAVTGESAARQTEDALEFRGEVDRVYLRAPREILVCEPGRRLRVRADGFPDAVVWNPGAEKCGRLADMEPAGYRQMVCVEAAVAGTAQAVPAGSTWRGMQELIAEEP